MKLEIENIGPFTSKQEIFLDGITILAGINGAGKSTFGKVLYCFFSTFRNIEEQISKERINTISRLLLNRFREENIHISKGAINKIYEIAERIASLNATIGDVEERIEPVLSEISFQKGKEREIMKSSIAKSILWDDNTVAEKILTSRIESEFDTQIKNLDQINQESRATLSIKDYKISFIYDKSGGHIEDYFSLVKDILYLDNPNVLDTLDSHYFFDGDYSHKQELLIKMMDARKQGFSTIDQLLVENNLSRIEEKLNKICDGGIRYVSGAYRYVSDRFKDGLSIGNMATGLKPFAILKKALSRGFLEEDGVIIFDEPEIHLHPDWQRAWAEIIVLLNRDLGINVLLSTHSPDFLSFLELYIDKYEVNNRTHVYLLGRDRDDSSVIKDVSNEWDKVYEQLGAPFIQATEELDSINV